MQTILLIAPNVYAYKNWINGEIVDGPDIERYW